MVLFALPTNPLLIDTFKRRADYLKNSNLLHVWAKKNGVVFIDMGMQDVAEPEIYFSDMRHLSGEGARQYSIRLGQEMVNNGVLRINAVNTKK